MESLAGSGVGEGRRYNDMNAEKNSQEWVDGLKRTYRAGWMKRFRFLFFNMAFGCVSDTSFRTLDVGCGTGVFLKHLVDRGFKNARGIEPDSRLVPHELRGRIDIGAATRLPYKDEIFDCIYFFNVLHHLTSVQEYKECLDEADRCLKKGGILIFLEPHSPWFYKLEAIVSKALVPVWPFARNVNDMLIDERDTLAHFFENRSYIENYPRLSGYSFVKERRLIHQWFLVSRKS